MAVAMSAVHGSLVVVGLTVFLMQWWAGPAVALPGLVLGFVVLFLNRRAYFRMVPDKL